MPRKKNSIPKSIEAIKHKRTNIPTEELRDFVSLDATKSLPFDRPKTEKIAIKVINHYGDEALKVFNLRAQ